MTDETGDRRPELWELLWMIIEEATRKLPPEEKDPVMKAVSEYDEAQIECLGRSGDNNIMFRVCDIVFHVPLVAKTTKVEPAQELPSPNFFPDRK